MDESQNQWREITAALIAVTVLIAGAIILSRCSEPAAAQIKHEVLADPATTTTSTSVPKEPEKVTSETPVLEFRNDHTHLWDLLAICETGGNWQANTGNGFGGGLQFAHTQHWSTWLSFGGGTYAPNPWEASREQQIDIAEQVLASSGWKAWPGCSRKNGWL